MKKKSRDAKPTVNGESSPADPLPVRGDGAASPGAGVARKGAPMELPERLPLARARLHI